MENELRSDAFLSTAIERYGDAVLRLALCQVRNCHDAEDIFQEVFLRLLRDTTVFIDGEHLKAWLIKVTISRCNDYHRSGWIRRKVSLDSITEQAYITQEQLDLWQAVSKLPDAQRIVVHLFYQEGYSAEEIAQIIECKTVTVRTRLLRARKKLKEKLKEDDDDEFVQQITAEH